MPAEYQRANDGYHAASTLRNAYEPGASVCPQQVVRHYRQRAEDGAEEKELRRVLLMQIIGRDVRRRLQRRLVQRFILSRILAH